MPGHAGEGFSARLKRLERSRKKKANVRHLGSEESPTAPCDGNREKIRLLRRWGSRQLLYYIPSLVGSARRYSLAQVGDDFADNRDSDFGRTDRPNVKPHRNMNALEYGVTETFDAHPL